MEYITAFHLTNKMDFERIINDGFLKCRNTKFKVEPSRSHNYNKYTIVNNVDKKLRDYVRLYLSRRNEEVYNFLEKGNYLNSVLLKFNIPINKIKSSFLLKDDSSLDNLSKLSFIEYSVYRKEIVDQIEDVINNNKDTSNTLIHELLVPNKLSTKFIESIYCFDNNSIDYNINNTLYQSIPITKDYLNIEKGLDFD